MESSKDVEADVVLRCSLNVKVLNEALSSIRSNKAEEVTIEMGESTGKSLRFTVEEHGCMQLCALLERESFSFFHCSDTGIKLRVSLDELVECLSVYSGLWEKARATLDIKYNGYGHPLVLAMQDKNVTVKSELSTIEGTILSDFRFLSTDVYSSIIVQSDAIRDAVQEIDFIGADVGELHIGPQEPKFSLRCSSTAGAVCAIDFPDPDSGTPLFTSFRSRKKQVCYYRINLMKRTIRGLQQSETTKLRMNADGMLSLVMKMKVQGVGIMSSCYLEYILVAEEMNESEDDSVDATQTEE